jgi:DNA mismatch repair ATPase MutS
LTADDRLSADNDLRDLAGIRRISAWVSREPLDVGEIAASFYEYLNLALLLDANALFIGARVLTRHRDALIRMSEWVGNVDASLSVASLRAEAGPWRVPQAEAPGAATVITGVWHPMLESAVPNSIRLNGGEGVILTGSNMSGKSTFLRSVGVCVVLADAINTCPAESYAGPPIRVRTCIGRTDDLAAGKSYYLAEVEAVLDILRSADAPGAHLFLFDELFRGTNTVERLAAGESVLRALVRRPAGMPPAAVIVATHDGELVSMLRDCYTPFHLAETISDKGLTFDYQLRTGPATTRSAIALLELNGAPASLLSAARARAGQLDAERALRR